MNLTTSKPRACLYNYIILYYLACIAPCSVYFLEYCSFHFRTLFCYNAGLLLLLKSHVLDVLWAYTYVSCIISIQEYTPAYFFQL